jgi:hypothetical protein
MNKNHKDARWVFGRDIEGEAAAPGVLRRILAYCDALMCVEKGDTLCKRDGIKHGCACLEKGILADFFTPMREDFLQ